MGRVNPTTIRLISVVGVIPHGNEKERAMAGCAPGRLANGAMVK